MGERPSQVARYRDLAANRNYRVWFVSSLGTSLGDWVGLFALQVLVVSLADAGSRLALFGLGGIMLARLLPSTVFGPVAGVIADRYDRRRLMVGADLTRAGLFVALAFSRNLVLLFGLVFLVECASLVYLAAKNAVLPAIVDRDDLAQANQLTLAVTYGPLPFGAAIDGLLALLGGRLGLADPTMAALILTGMLFAASGALLVRMHPPPRPDVDDGGPEDGPVQQLRAGLAAVAARPLIRSLVLGVMGVFLGAGVVIALGPEFVRAELGRMEGDWYGLMTVVGIGLLLGIVAAPALLSRLDPARVIGVGLVGAAAATVVTATLASFVLVQAAGFTLGALAGTAFVGGFTMLHERTDEQSRGRVFAAVYTGTRVAMFAALALGPFLAGIVGDPSLTLGDTTVTVSGIRAVLLTGGVFALVSATAAAMALVRHSGTDQ